LEEESLKGVDVKTWKVVETAYEEMEKCLNACSAAGWEVFSILRFNNNDYQYKIVLWKVK
jgi:hypothetical protein